MNVATARIDYKGAENEVCLDTTVKSAQGLDKVFAPTWRMVMDYKQGKISWTTYTQQYYALLRERWAADNLAFICVLDTAQMIPHIKKDYTIVFQCYCNASHAPHCHRYLLVNIFEAICKSRDIPFTYLGELT